jgi:hypothetical protein
MNPAKNPGRPTRGNAPTADLLDWSPTAGLVSGDSGKLPRLLGKGIESAGELFLIFSGVLLACCAGRVGRDR